MKSRFSAVFASRLTTGGMMTGRTPSVPLRKARISPRLSKRRMVGGTSTTAIFVRTQRSAS
eukprot:6663044-Prorocentrum_lima.AAC.1